MSIIVMICFARSGGSILNQCLGSLPNVVMMSEVNPLGGGAGKGQISYQTIKSQAKNWYSIDLKSDGNNFVASALELEKICEKNNRQLIIRDWSYINFMPDKENNYNPPQRLLILESLKGKCKLIPFAFVRDAIDVWISCCKLISIMKYDLEKFFGYYLNYIKAIIDANIPIFKYEDFTLDPGNIIKNICSYSGLQYSSSYNNFNKFDKINGDVQFGNSSRGIRQNNIKPLLRRIIPRDKIMAINQCAEIIEANSLLGYPPLYESKEAEKFFEKFLDDIYYNIYNILEVLRRFSRIFKQQ